MAPIKPEYRSKLVRVCNQVVELERPGQKSVTGKITWQDPVEIKSRYVEKQQRVVNPQGTEVPSSAEVTVVNQVAIGEKIRGRPVVGRETIVNRAGTTLGLRLYL